MLGIFGDVFDFNEDGHMNAFEIDAEIRFLDMLMEDEEETELERSGLDPEELEFMEPWERREALEEAGLDPDAYDF